MLRRRRCARPSSDRSVGRCPAWASRVAVTPSDRAGSGPVVVRRRARVGAWWRARRFRERSSGALDLSER